MTPEERIRAALIGKTKGWRGPKLERDIVALFAGDVLTLVDSILAPDPVCQRLREGSTGVRLDGELVQTFAYEHEINIYADHAFHLLEQLEGSSSVQPA